MILDVVYCHLLLFLLYIISFRLAGDHLAVPGDVFDDVFLCCPFSHVMSWMRSGT